MKKTIFLLVLVMFQSVGAQDTVHIRDFRTVERYFVPEWPDHFPYDSARGVYIGYIEGLGEDLTGNGYTQRAWKMYTKDTLQVYGIAAGLSTIWRLDPEGWRYDFPDTSCEYVYDYLRLYEAESDSLRHIGEELLVNLRYTPVSYFVDMDLWAVLNVKRPIFPIYERYFSEPVTVADSFYVGRRYRTDHLDRKSVSLIMVADTMLYERESALYYYGGSGWYYGSMLKRFFPVLFPILTPPDTVVNPADTVVLNPGDTLVVLPGDTLVIGGDTLVNSGDTLVIIPGEPFVIGGDTLVVNTGDTLVVIPGSAPLSLRQSDFVYRYTALQPNPATDQVRITSSFGISRIEAYDLRGRLIKEFSIPNSQFSINLDVSSWPRGTYLLRITTPAGTTTKKLLIR